MMTTVVEFDTGTTEPSALSVRLHSALRASGDSALRVLRCPATWLCLAAVVFYSALAVNRVDQHLAGSYDFGVIFQVIHGWAFHGYPAEPLQMPLLSNEWGDHFAPILALLAPLLWIHDSPSVIAVAQVVLICAAGVPIYFAVRRMFGPVVGAIACTFYLSSIEVQNAIGFDVHENMFEPLLIAIAIERALARKWTAASVAIGLTLLCYEDMGAMVLLFGLWAARHRKWRHAAVLCVLGPVVMFLYTGVIVPEWGRDLPYWQLRHFDYQNSLGASTMSQAIVHALEHPHHFLHLLVATPVKVDTWWLLIGSVGFVCLASPITYLGSTTVILLMVSDNSTHWSTNYHFYLQVAPIIVIGAADGLRRLGLLGRRLWRRMKLKLPSSMAFLRSRTTWRAAVAGLALVALYSSLVMEHEKDRIAESAAWTYIEGKQTRSAALNAAINEAARYVPSGQNVYVSGDLGTVVVARDTDVSMPQYADYLLFDPGTQSIPAGFEQTMEAQGFHVVFVAHGLVYVMER